MEIRAEARYDRSLCHTEDRYSVLGAPLGILMAWDPWDVEQYEYFVAPYPDHQGPSSECLVSAGSLPQTR